MLASSATSPPRSRPGETLDVEVVVRTRGVGPPVHQRHGGLQRDLGLARGRRPDGGTRSSRAACSTPTAASTPAPTVSRRSSSTTTASTWTAASRRTSASRSTTTASGPARRASCTTASTVPKDARGAITLSAGTHYRKFSRDYTTFSLGAAHPSLPVTTLASDTVTLPVTPDPSPAPGDGGERRGPRGNPDPLWLRWNDYGIGLFLQGDLKGAARAWTKVGRARARQAGRPAEPRARRDRRGPPRRREGLARRGRAAPARLGQDRVLPRDARQGRGPARRRREGPAGRPREVPARPRRLEQPRPRLLARRPVPGRVAAYGKTLAIDPEDLNAHYNLMRVYRALGDRKNADLHDAAYRKYKDDETIRAIAGRLPPRESVGQPRVAARSTSTPRPSRRPRRRRRGSRRSGRRATRPTAGISTRAHPPLCRASDYALARAVAEKPTLAASEAGVRESL